VQNFVSLVAYIAEPMEKNRVLNQSLNQSVTHWFTHPAYLMPREPMLPPRNITYTLSPIGSSKCEGHSCLLAPGPF